MKRKVYKSLISIAAFALLGPVITPNLTAGPYYTITYFTAPGPREINKHSEIVIHSSSDLFRWTEKEGMVSLFQIGGPNGVINDRGDVACPGHIDGVSHIVVFWSEKTGVVNLGHLGEYPNLLEVHDINERGQIVGWSTYDDEGNEHAYLARVEEGILDLGTLGGERSRAVSINKHGQVVGESRTESEDKHAFLWTAQEGMLDLGTLGGTFSRAVDINDKGEVLGLSRTESGDTHAFLWTTKDGMVDITAPQSVPGGLASWEINNSSQVIGLLSIGPDTFHAFFWEDGEITDLGTLGGSRSWAYAINKFGQVVGSSYTSSGDSHAFIWENGMMSDLNDFLSPGSGWVLEGATDINDAGQIIGSASINGQGPAHGFLMTPVP